jgi:hypothetical protein
VTGGPVNDHRTLALYVSGTSPHSIHAIENAHRLCAGRVRQSLELGPPENIDEHATPGR